MPGEHLGLRLAFGIVWGVWALNVANSLQYMNIRQDQTIQILEQQKSLLKEISQRQLK